MDTITRASHTFRKKTVRPQILERIGELEPRAYETLKPGNLSPVISKLLRVWLLFQLHAGIHQAVTWKNFFARLMKVILLNFVLYPYCK